MAVGGPPERPSPVPRSGGGGRWTRTPRPPRGVLRHTLTSGETRPAAPILSWVLSRAGDGTVRGAAGPAASREPRRLRPERAAGDHAATLPPVPAPL